MKLSVYIPLEDSARLNALEAAAGDAITIVSPRHLVPDGPCIHALIALGSVTIPLVAKIVVEQIRARRFVSVKYRGVEVAGLTTTDTQKIIRVLQQLEPAGAPTSINEDTRGSEGK